MRGDGVGVSARAWGRKRGDIFPVAASEGLEPRTAEDTPWQAAEQGCGAAVSGRKYIAPFAAPRAGYNPQPPRPLEA